MPDITMDYHNITANDLALISAALERLVPRIAAEVIGGGDSGALQLAKTQAFFKRVWRIIVKQYVNEHNRILANVAVVPVSDAVLPD